MKLVKEVLHFIVIVLGFAGIVYGINQLKIRSTEFSNKTQVTEKTCIVTEITYFQVGQKSIAQLDPEWQVKTSCGYSYTSRQRISIGDTIKVRVITIKGQ